jgi:hypothetical protein
MILGMRRPFVRLLIICALWALGTPLFFGYVFTSPSWTSVGLVIGSAAGLGAFCIVAGDRAKNAQRRAMQWLLYSVFLFCSFAAITAGGLLILCWQGCNVA